MKVYRVLSRTGLLTESKKESINDIEFETFTEEFDLNRESLIDYFRRKASGENKRMNFMYNNRGRRGLCDLHNPEYNDPRYAYDKRLLFLINYDSNEELLDFIKELAQKIGIENINFIRNDGDEDDNLFSIYTNRVNYHNNLDISELDEFEY